MFRIFTIALLALFSALIFVPSQAEACGMRYKPMAKKEVKKEDTTLRAAALKSMFDLIDEAEEALEAEELEQEAEQEELIEEQEGSKPKEQPEA